MSTSLPEKRIKKIKLPGDVSGDKTYEIIPDKMQSNNFQATLPTLTEDATIVITDDITVSQTTLPGTGSRPETTTTTISLFGTDTDIKSYTRIDSSLSSSSKNPVANDVIYNAVSNKVDAEDFQELEQIALTTLGILTGEPLSPVLAITDGNYYPTVSDSGKRWKMGKADSATFFKIYDVNGYTSVHLKSVSRAGHILTDTAPSDFNTKIHQNPTQVGTWYEAASVSDSEQADVLPKNGYTPYDKDLTTNGKHYLIVYEVNAAQAIEVINGGGYSPIYTSMFTNDGDGNSPYATLADIPAQVNADWNASSGAAEILNKPTLGTAASKNTGTSSGNVPVLDSNGKLADSVIPAVAITDTYEAASEAAMLALSAEKGDVCIRSDLNKSFILSQTPASTLANWKELKTPTDAVLSVNGETGAVTLDAADVGVSLTTTTGSEAITVDSSSLNVATRDTAQSITAKKTFTAEVELGSSSTAGQGKITFLNPAQGNQGDWYITSATQGQGLKLAQVGQSGITISRPKIEPLTNNYWSIGSNSSKFKDIWLTNGLRKDNSSYGLLVPTMASWTANKEIATTDQLPIIITLPDFTLPPDLTQTPISASDTGTLTAAQLLDIAKTGSVFSFKVTDTSWGFSGTTFVLAFDAQGEDNSQQLRSYKYEITSPDSSQGMITTITIAVTVNMSTGAYTRTVIYAIAGWVKPSSSNYLKSASVSSNTLTLTKGDNTTVTYTPILPTVSNETISIYNGEADLIDSFTLNQSTSKNITLPYIPSQAADVNEYGQKYVNPKQVRQFQTIFGIAPTLLTNINGHDLSGVYNTVSTTIGGYPAVKIVNVSGSTNLTFDESHNYMRKITGSEFTPIYGDGTVPQFSYIVDGQGNLYKPQWDSTNGLVLYVVNKLALSTDMPQIIDMRS